MIDAVIFDIGNVLLRFDFEKALSRIRPHCHRELDFAVIEPLRDAFESGGLTRAAFLEQVIRRIEYRGSEAEVVQAYEEIFEVNEPMVAFVERLAGRCPRYLLSNTSEIHLDHILRTYPFFSMFDDAVYSFRARLLKPGREIFEHAIRQFGVAPERTIYIDDMAPNVEAAAAAGLQAIHYHPDDHTGFLAEIEARLKA